MTTVLALLAVVLAVASFGAYCAGDLARAVTLAGLMAGCAACAAWTRRPA